MSTVDDSNELESESVNQDNNILNQGDDDDNLIEDDEDLLEDEDDDDGANEDDENDDGDEDSDVEDQEDSPVPKSNETLSSSSAPDVNRKRPVLSADKMAPSKKRRQEKEKKTKTKSKSKSRINVQSLFDDEAQEGDEDEEEEIDARHTEEVIGEDERLAAEAVERRHQRTRERNAMDATEIARDFEERARKARLLEKSMQYGAEGIDGVPRISAVMGQSNLPSVNDPSIWRLKVKTGEEQKLVLSIMRKAIDSRNRGGPLRIKSAFSNGTKGYIYIEALAEPLAREAITGLRGIYQSSLTKIGVREMTSVVTVTIKKKPLEVGQWVRLKRGPLKGDLAKVVDILEGGVRAMIQAVPRPDYTQNAMESVSNKPGFKSNKDNLSKVRPQQRLFDPVEVRNAGGDCFRRHMPGDNSYTKYDFWNNEYFRDGFVYKDVKVETFLQTENVKPTMEENKWFLSQRSRRRAEREGFDEENEDDEDDEDDIELDENGEPKALRSIVKGLADQLPINSESDTSGISPYVVDDLVQVVSGELKGIVAKIKAVHQVKRTVTVVPHNSSELQGQEFEVEISVLMKYVPAGSHVKVTGGEHMGQTGRVVSLKALDGKPTAVILTDGVNTEILCDVINLQMSADVAAGLGHLMGYELYDLVLLNENESAVVVGVGAEKLRVINHMDLVKELFPQEIQAKRNLQSQKTTGYDSQQNTVGVGDVVSVIQGSYAKMTGTIKHIMKGSFWLHSTLHLKNSGIFVTRGRSCVVAGNKNAFQQPGTSESKLIKPVRRIGKDESLGKTLKITKGMYKGLLAQIVESNADTYTVELLAKMKKITIEKSKTVVVGDKEGSLASEARSLPAYDGAIPATPFYTQDTPHYLQGGVTPHHYGNETPGSMTPGRTPGHDESSNIWTAQANYEALNSYQTSDFTANIPRYEYPSHDYSPSNSSGPNSHSQPQSSPWAMSDSSPHAGRPRHSGGSVYSMAGSDSHLGMSPYSPYSGSQTPNSYSQTPNSTGGVGSGSRTTVSWTDWIPDVLVTFKEGQMSGRVGVVREVIKETETVRVQLRNERGVTAGGLLQVHPSEVTLAEPVKRSRVCVLAGQGKGKFGTLKAIAGKDAILETDSTNPEMFKLSLIAMIN